MLKLFFYCAHPAHSMGYCSGGAGVIAATCVEHAISLLLLAGVDTYGGDPVEIVVPDEPGVLFYEGVAE
ncbi:MAG: hypothetical protein ACRC1H_10040 [Caldilineaceae bacterium]